MERTKNKLLSWALPVLLPIFFSSSALAEETIIQQEKLSFERCLEVITTSQDKLSIAPEVEYVSDQKRMAVFTLVDGTLTITCDGLEGNVTVSTSSD